MVHSLLQLSETWPCHILFVGRMKFTCIKTNLGGCWDLFSLFHSSFLSPSLSEKSPDMTEILLTGTLFLNSSTSHINDIIGQLRTLVPCFFDRSNPFFL